MDEGDEVDGEVADDAARFAGLRHAEARLVELVGLDRRLRHAQTPAAQRRVGVDLVAHAHHLDDAGRLDEHVDRDGRRAVRRWTRLNDSACRHQSHFMSNKHMCKCT